MKWLALILLATPAIAQEATVSCMPREDMAKALKDGWGEHSVFQGVAGNGKAVLEIFARPDGSWTAVIVSADGTACPAVAGDIWLGFGIPQGVDG